LVLVREIENRLANKCRTVLFSPTPHDPNLEEPQHLYKKNVETRSLLQEGIAGKQKTEASPRRNSYQRVGQNAEKAILLVMNGKKLEKRGIPHLARSKQPPKKMLQNCRDP